MLFLVVPVSKIAILVLILPVGVAETADAWSFIRTAGVSTAMTYTSGAMRQVAGALPLRVIVGQARRLLVLVVQTGQRLIPILHRVSGSDLGSSGSSSCSSSSMSIVVVGRRT